MTEQNIKDFLDGEIVTFSKTNMVEIPTGKILHIYNGVVGIEGKYYKSESKEVVKKLDGPTSLDVYQWTTVQLKDPSQQLAGGGE